MTIKLVYIHFETPAVYCTRLRRMFLGIYSISSFTLNSISLTKLIVRHKIYSLSYVNQFCSRSGEGAASQLIIDTLSKGVSDGLIGWHLADEGPSALELVLTRVECVTLACHRILLEHVAKHPDDELTVWDAFYVSTILAHRKHCLRNPGHEQYRKKLSARFGINATAQSGEESRND